MSTPTRQTLLDAIHHLHDTEGAVNCTLVKNSDITPSRYQYKKKFETVSDAIKEAGYRVSSNMNQYQYDKEELLDYIRKFNGEDYVPTVPDFKNTDRDIPCKNTYLDRFGSWTEAIKQAGYDETRGEQREYDKKFLIEHLQKHAKTTSAGDKMAPNRKFIREVDGPSSWTYENHFGSYGEAVEEANLKQNHISQLEQIASKILDDLDIEYTEQKEEGKFRVDFYLDNYDIAIECDGIYWHAHPDKDKNDKPQIKKKKLDQEKNEYFRSIDTGLVRFWGKTMIKSNQDKFKSALIDILAGDMSYTDGEHVFGPEPNY